MQIILLFLLLMPLYIFFNLWFRSLIVFKPKPQNDTHVIHVYHLKYQVSQVRLCFNQLVLALNNTWNCFCLLSESLWGHDLTSWPKINNNVNHRRARGSHSVLVASSSMYIVWNPIIVKFIYGSISQHQH